MDEISGQKMFEEYRVLDPDGSVVADATVPDLPDDEMVEMYREMKFMRHFDERAVSLQRQGRLGTYAPLAGQEAAQVGSTYALKPDDWILPTYRENGVALARDVPPSGVLRYWMGDERGNTHLTKNNVFPYNIGVGALVPHASGVAMGNDYLGTDRVTLCHFGDGATSEGDFHEGLNFAGVFDVPVVFFCNNNQWAISVPREQQTASQTIAQKALAYGFRGVRVDGMDPLAVYSVTGDAVERAHTAESGGGSDTGLGATRPTLIEAVLYRFGPHTTADDPTRYRDTDEVESWERRDPISRFERFLLDTGRLDREDIDSIENDAKTRMEKAVRTAEETQDPPPSDMFDHVFAERTDELAAQCEYLYEYRDTTNANTVRTDE